MPPLNTIPLEILVPACTAIGALFGKGLDMLISSSKNKVDEHAAIRTDLLKIIDAEREERQKEREEFRTEIVELRGRISQFEIEKRAWETERVSSATKEIELLKQISMLHQSILDKEATIARLNTDLIAAQESNRDKEARIVKLEGEMAELRRQ